MRDNFHLLLSVIRGNCGNYYECEIGTLCELQKEIEKEKEMAIKNNFIIEKDEANILQYYNPRFEEVVIHKIFNIDDLI